MILYNLTIIVDYDQSARWLKWMKEKHMPDVLATGMFVEGKIARILAEEEGGESYSVQYFAKTMEDFERYESEFAPALRQDHEKHFAGKFAAFRTLLHVVHQDDRDEKS